MPSSSPSALTSDVAALVMIGAGLCLALTCLFVFVWRTLRQAWAAQFAFAFGLQCGVYALRLAGAAQSPALQVGVQAFGLGADVLITLGIWRYARPDGGAHDGQFWFTLALIGAGALGEWVGFDPHGLAAFVLELTSVSWGVRFLRASRSEPGMGHGLNAVACLIHPMIVLLAALHALPASMARVPGLLPLAAFGLALLFTGLLRAQRQAAEAERRLTVLNESLEQRIAERTLVLRETVDGLESFNRNVSHDLRGPLGGIAGVAALARERMQAGDSAGAEHMLGVIATQAEDSVRLVDALLELARSAELQVQRSAVDLGVEVQAVCETLRVELGLERLPVQVGALPVVIGDAALLRQVFRNLVGNALKFTRGRPDPRIEIGAVAATDGQAELFVRDNGIGFAPGDAQRLFTPFVRAHGQSFEGYGIGLSIVRRIVSRHGGWIRAESGAEGGAVFRFTLGGASVG